MKPIGIIGDSGLNELADLKNVDQITIDTPFGEPSSPLTIGDWKGQKVAFLSRHGTKHSLLPEDINYRANIYALKQAQVEKIISLSAVASLTPELKPGNFCVPDQFIDQTQKRKNTFLENSFAEHLSFAEPTSVPLAKILEESLQETSEAANARGTYVCIEGPAFPSRAESKVYQSWGASMIGMTNATEAKLAREAEIEYATLAMVSHYDAWFEEVADIKKIIKTKKTNLERAQTVLKVAIHHLKEAPPESCHRSSKKFSILTSHSRESSKDLLPEREANL